MMTDQEKKILEALDTRTQDIEIPKSLEPENIQKLLESGGRSNIRKSNVGKKKWKRSYTYTAAAAALTLVLGIAAFQSRYGGEILRGRPNTDGQDSGKDMKIENVIASAEDYQEIYEYVKAHQDVSIREEKGEMMKESLADGAKGSNRQTVYDGADTSESKMSADKGASYSDTNVRTEGIGEADIVKTDGTWLYALNESLSEIVIVDPSEDRMKAVGTIKAKDNAQISEFYVSGDQVFVMETVSQVQLNRNGDEIYIGECTELATYDISDITEPRMVASVTQSGFYHSSRFADGYLYIFSDYFIEHSCKASEMDLYIPKVNGKLMPESCVYLPPVKAANQYLVITAVKADKPDEVIDEKAVLSEFGECYVSSENIYVYENTDRSALMRSNLADVNQTMIRKISYKDGQLKGAAQGKVTGSLNDSFSIDEYDGTLRLVTTIYGSLETTNAVYVLDQNLDTIGKIKDIAEGEIVYSARFFGRTGYFVTYRNTDPLFSVDFSDPKNPKIIGELKIPGFSEYLHPYQDGLLVGIGMDTDEKTGVTNGVKVSMFDISDPSDVKEVQKYTIGGAYYSALFDDYKAVLVDDEKNMIGFSVYGDQEEYYIFSYDAKAGFRIEMQEDVNGSSYMNTRGLYIGDTFYVVKGNAIESYRMGSFEKVDDLLL